MRVNLDTIGEWCGGEMLHVGGEMPLVLGISTDSRSIREGDLFVALTGPQFDGHNFVEHAFAEGAVAALVRDASVLQGRPGVVVGDPLYALGQIAHRFRWEDGLIPWVAVTGSNGKTTTRSMIAHMLQTRGVVAQPEANFNNLVGMPLSILRMPEKAWAGVLELGTSAPGEIARLAQIATPTVAVVTCIGPAHLEGLGSMEAIAEEKASIYDLLPQDGLAVYPGHDPYTNILCQHIAGRRASFAVEWPADMTAEAVEADPEGVRFTVRGVSFSLPVLGVHNVRNCMAALLAVEALGISLEEASEALRSFEPVADRLQCLRTGHLTILNDVYNANPSSLRAAIETAVLFEAPRRVAVIGDMLELGTHARAMHRDVGRFLAATELDVILCVGKQSVALAEAAATAAAGCVVRHFPTVQALQLGLRKMLRDGDFVLVKGSRGMRMETVVKSLQSWKPRG